MSAPRRHPLARADIEREARWYAAQQPGLGSDFVDEVHRVIDGIAGNPLRHSIRFGNWRRANLRRFPHAVFYQVIDDEPVVFAVLHAKRDHGPLLETRLRTV
ncbi:MAG TPA: type II toxin-antitoxin system RelE/ParE family toxin [Candidatus Paceibacterota bacterium]|nr:type II toxin-antitoxin system RelE/ParE family toxin [Candidatus Paceibacterota bacterium]